MLYGYQVNNLRNNLWINESKLKCCYDQNAIFILLWKFQYTSIKIARGKNLIKFMCTDLL